MKRTMLVVDDSEMNREILSLLFQDSFDTIEAENGSAALDVLEACRGNIDVILLDLIMPEMDGHAVLEKIRARPDYAKIPVVVITASENTDDQVRAFQLGASDFVTKPFVPEIVVSRVRNAVESARRYTVLEEEKEQIQLKSELDLMTGMYNKTTTERMVEEQLMHSHDRLHALLVIDIDNFKSVNDHDGHLVGDHTIRIIANQIVSQFRSTDVAGRVGGDEFVVFMPNIPSREIARRKAAELAQLLKYKPNLTIPANVSVSVGLAFSDGLEGGYVSLFHRADEALYQAKRLGKARVCEFGQEYLPIEQDARQALLLFSRNRNVCSTVQAVYSMSHIVVEAISPEDLSGLSQQLKEKIVLSYLDVSDQSDDGAAFWETMRRHEPWLWNVPNIAICEEGNLHQFQLAMQGGTTDILTVPIELESLKRRTRRYLKMESAQIVAKEIDLADGLSS